MAGAAAVPSLRNTTTATPIHATVVEFDGKQLVRWPVAAPGEASKIQSADLRQRGSAS
jgi:hypothetical protein